MKDITDTILDLQNKSLCVDFLKSKFIMCSECLMSRILSSNNSLDHDTEIMLFVNDLINSKDDLILNLKELINYIELLNLELQDQKCLNYTEEE